MNPNLVSDEQNKKAQKEVNVELEMEEIMWKQWSRVPWLKE